MEIYNAKVLLGGSRDNEVRKNAITAAEVTMLRHIHGDDHVIDLSHVGTCKISNAQVREMLTLTYADGDQTKGGPAILRNVFGPAGAPLPVEIEGVKLRAKQVDIPVEKVVRWREVKVEPAAAPMSDEPSFAD